METKPKQWNWDNREDYDQAIFNYLTVILVSRVRMRSQSTMLVRARCCCSIFRLFVHLYFCLCLSETLRYYAKIAKNIVEIFDSQYSTFLRTKRYHEFSKMSSSACRV